MNTRTLSVIGLVLLGAILFLGGFFWGQGQASVDAFFPGSMMFTDGPEARAFGYNMMGNNANVMNSGLGMMGNGADFSMMGTGSSMMGGGYDMMGNGFGMMGGYGFGGLADVDPLSIEEAETAVNDYLASLGSNDWPWAKS